jgi:hypothetical protein
MKPNANENQAPYVIVDAREPKGQVEPGGGAAFQLRRWLVSFASGRDWYSVGEYVALDANSAIDRAIEIFGAASAYQAEEIPWDAAPLLRPNPLARQELR